MKEIILKDKKYFFEYEEKDGWFEISVSNAKNERIGFVSAVINYNAFSTSIWLMKIFVEENERYQGIGQKLMDYLHAVAKIKRISAIEGKFYPENSYAKEFYLKNGYSIDKDGYETFIYKSIPTRKNLANANYEEKEYELFR